jgi:hypothetical protein
MCYEYGHEDQHCAGDKVIPWIIGAISVSFQTHECDFLQSEPPHRFADNERYLNFATPVTSVNKAFSGCKFAPL